jgi:DNA polymerase elongation subunit (family B)
MCSELELRSVTLLEADTDGVYFSVPAEWTLEDERRVVSEVDTLLPALVHLEFEGRYAAMLSHEPKNYALLTYSDELILRGVAFRSSRAEPFGETFLRRATRHLLNGDIAGVRDAYLATLDSLRKRELLTDQVASRVRLTKTAVQYRATRETRRELVYEAMLASGRGEWTVSDRVHVYRTKAGGRIANADWEQDPRDYDVDHYARILRESFAIRLSRAFTPEDYAAVFAEPDQLTLFSPPMETIATVLRPVTVTPSGI